MTLTVHQSSELSRATAGPIGLLIGGPGTGKTRCVGELILSLSKTIGEDQIAVGAPTGKARVRVAEVLHAMGVNVRTGTWHSLLRGGTDGRFSFDRNNPLPYRVIIGDETSMVDTDLGAAIFRAMPRGFLMLLVGDQNQLPPVGHGAMLRDLIASNLPCGELTEIMRNSGGIVEACHAIRQQRPWTCGDNLRLVEAGQPEQQIAAMLRTIQEQSGAGLDPIRDVQILAAVNAKSPLARKALNQVLQYELNAGGERAGNNPFRIGDKIVSLKNARYRVVDCDQDKAETNDQGEVYVANGELGYVQHVEPTLTIARLENPTRVVKIPRGTSSSNSNDGGAESDGSGGDGSKEDADQSAGTGCSWDLGYCLSVHKSQGSEWPVVITMLDDYPGARMVCSREWLYTALSRAKQSQHLIGLKATADAMVRRPAIWRRKTFLRELIQIERAKREVAEL